MHRLGVMVPGVVISDGGFEVIKDHLGISVCKLMPNVQLYGAG